MHKLILGLGGSSGAIYARLLLDRLSEISDQVAETGIVMSRNAIINWDLENPLHSVAQYGHKVYASDDFMAPFASGSSRFDVMIICPCSMGTIARIAAGFSDDLMTRAADVMLKERRKLIIVPREAPYSLIHLDNMRRLTEAGAVICPASPSFYSRPESIDAMCMTVIDRVLDLAGFAVTSYRWGSEK